MLRAIATGATGRLPGAIMSTDGVPGDAGCA